MALEYFSIANFVTVGPPVLVGFKKASLTAFVMSLYLSPASLAMLASFSLKVSSSESSTISSYTICLASTNCAIAPLQTFFEAVLDVEEAAELIELEASEALFDTELDTEDEADLINLDAFDAPFDAWLLPDEIEVLTASDRLEADFETTEALDLILLEAFSPTPGTVPITDDEAFADRLLALSLLTETMLSSLPCGVPITELEAWSTMLLADAFTTDATLSALLC